MATDSFQCDSCVHVGWRAISQCAKTEASFCPYVLENAKRPHLGGSAVFGMMFIAFTVISFAGQYQLVAAVTCILLIGAVLLIDRQIKTQTLRDKRSGAEWEQRWLVGLPLRTEFKLPPQLLEFKLTEGRLPNIPMSTVSLPITRDGVLLGGTAVEDVVTAVQYALTGLYFQGYLQFVRIRTYSAWFSTRPPRVPKICYGVKLIKRPLTPLEVAGSFERHLMRQLPRSQSPVISLDELLKDIILGEVSNPAKDLMNLVIADAVSRGTLEEVTDRPQTGWRGWFSSKWKQVPAACLSDYQRDKRLANLAWASIYDKNRRLARAIAEATRRTVSSHTDSGY